MRKFLAFILGALMSVSCFAISLTELYIVSDDGTYLGSFENRYSSDSVYNEYGAYGSPYSTKSIMNKYGNYGSEYSDNSPFNKYANSAPWIVDKYGNNYGRLSINRYTAGITNQSYQLALELLSIQNAL